jgi:hypothetical protein
MLLGGDDSRAGEAAVISGGESSDDDDDDEGTPTAKVLTVTITAAGEYREHAMAAEELILARFPEVSVCLVARGCCQKPPKFIVDSRRDQIFRFVI